MIRQNRLMPASRSAANDERSSFAGRNLLGGLQLREPRKRFLVADAVEADGDLVVVGVLLDRDHVADAELRVTDAHAGTQTGSRRRLILVFVGIPRFLLLEPRRPAAATVRVRPELVVRVRET